MNKAKALLATTDLSVNAIAPACGFSGVVSFCRAFQREQGMNALAFRKKSGALPSFQSPRISSRKKP